jgi:hypothetical protein
MSIVVQYCCQRPITSLCLGAGASYTGAEAAGLALDALGLEAADFLGEADLGLAGLAATGLGTLIGVGTLDSAAGLGAASCFLLFGAFFVDLGLQ